MPLVKGLSVDEGFGHWNHLLFTKTWSHEGNVKNIR